MAEGDGTIALRMEIEYLKAVKSLGGYKFYMFGYHAANWVNLNKMLDKKLPNPFKGFVAEARKQQNDYGAKVMPEVTSQREIAKNKKK